MIHALRQFLRNPRMTLVLHALGAVAALLTIALLPMPHEALLATGVFATTTQAKRLKEIAAEAMKIQKEYEGKPMPQGVGEKFDNLCSEMKEIQDEVDRAKKVHEMEQYASSASKGARSAVDPALPNGETKTETKTELPSNRIAGYMKVGDFFANLPKVKEFVSNISENGQRELKLSVPSLLRIKNFVRQGVVPIGVEMRKSIEAMHAERKDLPIFGTGVIEPERLSDMVRDDEQDRLRLRDIFNVSPTTSPLIEWVAMTDYTRAAAIVSEGATKPEAAAEFEVRSTSVKTIAVWIPVTEQQLQDAPALVNLIQSELLYDLGKEEEEQLMWETGSGQNFNGLVNQITAGRTTGGDTNFDKIRRAMTDVRLDGYEPNAMAIHPIDWENIQLMKGSDGHYVWIVTLDSATGESRVWGLRTVETVACENPAGTDRQIIVGDFVRGATIFDRMQAALAIGWKDDDFIKNLRTIRAEERIAFAVRRTKAFRKIDTL